MCDGKIHDQSSPDVWHGEIRHRQQFSQIAVAYRISLPDGAETLFAEIMGEDLLIPAPVIHGN